MLILTDIETKVSRVLNTLNSIPFYYQYEDNKIRMAFKIGDNVYFGHLNVNLSPDEISELRTNIIKSSWERTYDVELIMFKSPRKNSLITMEILGDIDIIKKLKTIDDSPDLDFDYSNLFESLSINKPLPPLKKKVFYATKRTSN